MNRRIWLVAVLLIAMTVLSAAQGIKTKSAPDFTLPNLDGDRITLSDTYGHGPIYISFWATWCKPCREELKIIEQLYEKYSDRGFRVLAINTEGPKAIGKISAFVKSNGWKFDILIDDDGEVFRRKYKGPAQPYSIMTDSQGQIVFSAVGFKPGDEKHIEEVILENLPEADNEQKESGAEE